MKAQHILFILLPLALVASSLLMPGRPGKAVNKGGKIGEMSLPPFKIGAPDNPFTFSKDQNLIILEASEAESAETRLSGNRRHQSDAVAEKVRAPDMLAMLIDSKTEDVSSETSSKNAQNSEENPRQPILPELIVGSGSGRQPQSNSHPGAVPGFGSSSPGVSGGALFRPGAKL